MKIRFNKFEKVAGLFVGVAAASCVVGMAGIAIKKGWFSSKVSYQTELESADGVHAGTVVQIAGLRVGSVTQVDLMSNDKVLIGFEILEKFKSKVRKDSRVQMFRPFILADKVFEVSVGSEGAEELDPGSLVPMMASTDIMDMLSGKKMGNIFGSFDKLADSLKIVGDSFADPKRTQALVKMLDRLSPLVENLNTLSVDLVKITGAATKEKRVEVILSNLARFSVELETVLPALVREAPDVGRQLGQIVTNVNSLAMELQKLTPAIGVIAPELPRTSRRAVEALDEMVITLKAFQKSFLLSGKAEEVRKEENRRPANTSEP